MKIQPLSSKSGRYVAYGNKNNIQVSNTDNFPGNTNKMKILNTSYGINQVKHRPSFGMDPVTIALIVYWSAVGLFFGGVALSCYKTGIDEQKREEEKKRLEAKKREDVNKISAQLEISTKKAESYVDKYLNIATIPYTKDGHEKGMNAVRGYGIEKYNLAMDVISPIISAQKSQDPRMRTSVPNGIILYGPPGSGKTYIADKLCEHLKEFGSKVEEITLTDDDGDKNADIIRQAFARAEENFNQTGKYTVINFTQDIDLHFRNREKTDEDIKEVKALMSCAENCASRGAVWIGTANNPKKVDSAILRPGRADIKMPIGKMEKFAVADMIMYSLYRYDEKKSADKIDYQKIIDTMGAKSFVFTPAEIDYIVKTAIKNKFVKEKALTAEMVISEMEKYKAGGFETLDSDMKEHFALDQKYIEGEEYNKKTDE